MNTVQSPMTVADYCAALERKELTADAEYQRSDKVWPPAAKSFLIETILLGYPLPKIFLFQKTDLKSKKTVKDIVDGQQRTRAIYDFFSGKLRLSKKLELAGAAGKKYDQLDDALKGSFLNYQLSIDLFVAATPQEIRQAFRRLNSYTVPLNPEELRHAEYQGAFKWFIYELTEEFEQRLVDIGVFGTKQIIRMQDAKLWTEFVHAVIYGVKTTKAKDLTGLYKRFDKHFAEDSGDTQVESGEEEVVDSFGLKDEMRTRVDDAMGCVMSLPEIHAGPLMKPHNFYSLLLAISEMQHPVVTLEGIFPSVDFAQFDREIAVTNLTKLGNAIEEEDAGDLTEFKQACSEKTNVDTQRIKRIAWLGRALQPELI